MRTKPDSAHVRLRSGRELLHTFMVLALASTLAACNQQTAPAPDGTPPVQVVAYTVESRQVPVSTELTGRVVAAVTAEIRPQTGGIVRKRLFTEGSDVKAGQVLYEIDPTSSQLLVGQPIDPALLEDPGTSVNAPLAPLIHTIGPVAEAPSELLQRHPDVLAAERTLRGAYANIGAARAARFPSITLTTSAGTASSQLSDLFGGGSGLWSFTPAVSVPIFDGGSAKATVRAAEVARDTALAEYEYSIQTAFQEVSDALTEQSNMQELIAARLSLLEANEKIYRLTDASYRKGLESSLSVLTAQRAYYNAQQTMIAARLVEARSWVTLYRVLGGGWQP